MRALFRNGTGVRQLASHRQPASARAQPYFRLGPFFFGTMADFLAAGFLAAGFLAADFLGADFLTAGFRFGPFDLRGIS